MADPTGLGVFYRNSRTRFPDITDGTSQTVMIGERAWAGLSGRLGSAPSGAVMRPGPRNIWLNATNTAPALVLVHNNWINIKNDSDGGLDDFSSYHPEASTSCSRTVPSTSSTASRSRDRSIMRSGLWELGRVEMILPP